MTLNSKIPFKDAAFNAPSSHLKAFAVAVADLNSDSSFTREHDFGFDDAPVFGNDRN